MSGENLLIMDKNKYLQRLFFGGSFLVFDLFMLFSSSVQHGKYHNLKYGTLATLALLVVFTSTVLYLREKSGHEESKNLD